MQPVVWGFNRGAFLAFILLTFRLPILEAIIEPLTLSLEGMTMFRIHSICSQESERVHEPELSFASTEKNQACNATQDTQYSTQCRKICRPVGIKRCAQLHSGVLALQYG